LGSWGKILGESLGGSLGGSLAEIRGRARVGGRSGRGGRRRRWWWWWGLGAAAATNASAVTAWARAATSLETGKKPDRQLCTIVRQKTGIVQQSNCSIKYGRSTKKKREKREDTSETRELLSKLTQTWLLPPMLARWE
jgi:hypothetical protein